MLMLVMLAAIAIAVHRVESSRNGGNGAFPTAQIEDFEARWIGPERSSFEEREREVMDRAEKRFVSGLNVGKSPGQQTWMPAGPNNVGGRTRALVFDGENPATIIAGSATGGVWKSSNAGTSWSLVSSPEAADGVTSLVQDLRPGMGDTWYYSTGEGYGRGNSRRGSGIYRSIDGGENWNRLPSSTPPDEGFAGFSYIWRLALDSHDTDRDVVFAATTSDLFRSLDGGGTWESVFAVRESPPNWSNEFTTDVAIAPSGSVIFSAGSTSGDPSARLGVFRSDDGETWDDITPAFWPAYVLRPVIGMDPTNPERFYLLALSEDPNTFQETISMFRYTSGSGGEGGTWEDLSAVLPHDFRGQYGYNLALGVHPSHPDTVWFGGVFLYRSADGFSSQGGVQQIDGLHVDQHAITFNPFNPDEILVGNDGGVYGASHGNASEGNWTSLSAGYRTTQFYTVALDESTEASELMVGGTQDNGVLMSQDAFSIGDWNQILPGDGLEVDIGAAGEFVYGTILAAPAVYRLNRGSNGDFSIHSHVIPPGNRSFLRKYRLDPNESNRLYMVALSRETGTPFAQIMRQDRLDLISQGTYQAVDQGWTALSSTNSAVSIREMALSNSNPSNRLYYALLALDPVTRLPVPGKLFRLDDSDLNASIPVEITGAEFPSVTIEDIAVNSANGDELLVAFPGYGVRSIFHSADAGQTWTDIGGVLEEADDGSGAGPSVWSVGILPLPGGDRVLLAGTTSGLFSTLIANGSDTQWQLEGFDAMGHSWVEAIDVRSADLTVVAATHGNGVFMTKWGAGETSSEQQASPESFTSEAPYPNPAKGIVRFPMSLSEPGMLSIRVVDMIGRIVLRIPDRRLEAGAHTYQLDISGLAAGTYMVALEMEGQTLTHPLVVLPSGPQ